MSDPKPVEYGSPNWIVCSYFNCVRALARQADAADPGDAQRQAAMLAIFMSTAAVEAFLNIWFRTFSQSGPAEAHRERIGKDLAKRRGLAYKFKTWPALCFGRSFETINGAEHEFLGLLERRNQLTHFTTAYDSIDEPGVRIEGLVNLSAYSSLAAKDARRSLVIAEETIREFFVLQGCSPSTVLAQVQSWTGRLPSEEEIRAARRGS